MAQNTTQDRHEYKPETNPDRIPAVRSWLSIEFTGFEPDDTQSSLLRRWRGDLIAVRSDKVKISVSVVCLQSDTPLRSGHDFADGLTTLMTYLNCACNGKKQCDAHVDTDQLAHHSV